MKQPLLALLPLVMVAACTPAGDSAEAAEAPTLSFFITSAGPGDGANLGGLAGADEHCARLAAAAGAPDGVTWHAYLSSAGVDGSAPVNARDRIGQGPWYNAAGALVAENLDQLLSELSHAGKEVSLTETGEVVNGRGDDPNRHDILTGSTPEGTVAGGAEATCNDWTSNAGDGSAMVGHHDRQGGGQNPNSWSSAHLSRGCGQADLQGTGGDGLFYCFAV